MAIMKFKNSNGEWQGIPAFKGENGKDGAIQYQAGDGIKIENDTITAEVTKDYVDGKLEELADMGFTPEIVDSLPTEDIKTNIIYMKPSEKSEDENIYEEWMYINNTWEMVGSTAVDLSNYYTKDEIATSFQEDIAIHPIYYTMPNNNPNWVYIGSELETLFINKINELYKSGKNVFIISIIDNSEPSIRYDCLVNITTVGTTKSIKFTALPNFIYDTNGLVKRRCFGNYSYSGGYTYNSTNDVFVHKATSGTAFALFDYSNDGGAYVQPSNVLTKNNTTAFTPDADYEPATKKYVDDSIVESNIVSIDVSGIFATPFSSSSGTGYASSNASVKAGLEKIARLGAGICIIHIYNRYSSMLCVYSNSYNHSDGGWGHYYTGSYQREGSGGNGTKAVITTKYGSDGTPQNIKISFDLDEGFVIKDNILTKTNTTSYTPSANYHPATKKYVDDAISNIDIPEPSTDAKGFYTYKMNLGNLGFAGEIDEYGYITHIITELCKTETNDLINKILTDGINQPVVVIENTNTEADLKTMLLFGFDTNYDPEIMQNLDFTLHGVANYIGSATGSLMMKYENSVMFSGTGIMTDGVWDATAIGIAITTQQSLTTDNTWEYTPTGDYNPATKKYVDDAVAGASGGITSESDPIFTGSEAYKITSTDTANWNSKLDSTQVNAAINTVLNNKSYLTSESDPLFSRSEAAKITSTDTANWNSKVDIAAVNNAINTTLNNKSYLTSESDPTVPAWAKQPNKPTYTASEVGALPASTVIPTVPTRLSGFTDDLGTSPVHSHSQYLTAHQDISGKQNKVLYGIADPTSDIGTEGDIYVKYV